MRDDFMLCLKIQFKRGSFFGINKILVQVILWCLKRDLPNKILSQKTTVLKSVITFSGLSDDFVLYYNDYICLSTQI